MKREEKSERHAKVGNSVENEVEMSFTNSERAYDINTHTKKKNSSAVRAEASLTGKAKAGKCPRPLQQLAIEACGSL